MEFKRVYEDAVEGTALAGYIEVAPKDLIMVFGKPCEGDFEKVSGQYFFSTIRKNLKRNTFSIYEYEATSMAERGLPSSHKFWNSEKPYRFHIGSNTDKYLDEFIMWVKKEIALSYKTADEVIIAITETLVQADGDFINDIANRVLTDKVIYQGDSLFQVKKD